MTGNTFTESASNPITHYCLSTPQQDWDGRGWKEEGKGGAERGAGAAGSAFPTWILTQAPGMPRKGGGQPPELAGILLAPGDVGTAHTAGWGDWGFCTPGCTSTGRNSCL